MEYKNLLLESRNQIQIVTINRPKSLNALNKTTMVELKHYFGSLIKTDHSVRGVVLTGAGEKAFVAGADISEFSSLSKADAESLAHEGQNLFFMIEQFDRPVIAAINGYALGGGCELAMACHMRIAGENARFGQPEINLGIIPGYGGTQRLIQYVGKSKALELLLTGSMIDGQEALNLGLINYLVPVGEEVERSVDLLIKVTQKAPLAVEEIIRCCNAYYDHRVNGFETEYKSFGKLMVTEDAKEGAQAFMEKRKANFKGKYQFNIHIILRTQF